MTPVGIAAALVDSVASRLDGADPGLLADLLRARALLAGMDDYVARCTSPASPALEALEERTRVEAWGGGLEQEMLSGHVEGQTLKMLVHATGATRVLEVGMFTGYSALAMAEALPPDGEVVACELDPDVAAFARSCFDDAADGQKIDVRVGPAADTLGDLAAEGQVFDAVFIDADKAGYAGYLQAVLDGGLLATGGFVAVDNTLMQGQPWTTEDSTANGDAIAAFNRLVTDDPRVEQVLVPLRDGVTLVLRVDGPTATTPT
ncbi:MAG: class I SAM-dependent methyltransferase [Nocardioidaceae bacterium]|nr:class I SAM-dependent methyltransferase [Nocardioidaceae bacterium]